MKIGRPAAQDQYAAFRALRQLVRPNLLKSALVILAAVLLLAGCGNTAASHDPFVGTWQAVGFGSGNGIAISKVSATTYHVAEVDHFKQHWFNAYSRYGNELTSHPGEFPYVEVFKFNPASRHLTSTSNGMAPEVLAKVSDSTPPPSPWPTKSP